MTMLTRIAIIAITTKISTRVKPFFMMIDNSQKKPPRGGWRVRLESLYCASDGGLG